MESGSVQLESTASHAMDTSVHLKASFGTITSLVGQSCSSALHTLLMMCNTNVGYLLTWQAISPWFSLLPFAEIFTQQPSKEDDHQQITGKEGLNRKHAGQRTPVP